MTVNGFGLSLAETGLLNANMIRVVHFTSEHPLSLLSYSVESTLCQLTIGRLSNYLLYNTFPPVGMYVMQSKQRILIIYLFDYPLLQKMEKLTSEQCT